MSCLSVMAVLPGQVDSVIHRELLRHAGWQRIDVTAQRQAQNAELRGDYQHYSFPVPTTQAVWCAHTV